MIFQMKKTILKPFSHASMKSEEHGSAKGPCIFLRLWIQHVKPDTLYSNYTVFRVLVNAVL